MVADAIESIQGSLVWRAISVIPISHLEIDDDEFTSTIEEERLFDSKNGVVVTVSCIKKIIKMNEHGDYLVSLTRSVIFVINFSRY